MKHFNTIFACLTFMLLISGAHGQGLTTASISGTVTTSHGEALIGVTVIVNHKPTGTQTGTITNAVGRFTVPNLRVGGPYEVTMSYVGFENSKVDNIFLKLGASYEIDAELSEEATLLSDVVITADGILDSEKTGAATKISNDQLTKIPTISRSAQDIYKLEPMSDGNSFAGRNDQYNNFSLDGSIFNNPFGLDAATPGGQADAQPISLDAIDQISVSIAPFDVSQSGFTGAAVNAVTKSGTNNLEGTVFGFYRNDNMTGSKVSGDEIIVPELRQFQSGFSIGGPVIKNKLFFFANFELERREDAGANFVADRGQSGQNVSRVLASDLNRVQTLLGGLGYETGPYEGFIHETNNQKGIFKLDWVVNNKHSLTATYNFLDASKQKPAHPSALGRRGPDAVTLQFRNSGYQINNIIHSGIIELKSRFSNSVSNKFQAGITSFRDSRDPFSTPAPVININRDGIRYIVAGHEPFSINNKLDQDVIQISNQLDYYVGNHILTAGGSFEKFSFDNSFNLGVYDDGFGTFGPGYASVDAFADSVASGYVASQFAISQNTFQTNNTNNSWALAETNVGQLAFYLQDQWAVNSDLTLTFGLRMDMPLYFDTEDKILENIGRNCCYDPTITYYDENNQAIEFDHTVLPEKKPLISPRFGFRYDVSEATKLRGGTGLFAGRFPFVWVGNQVANPNFFFYNITSPDFKFPQVWKSNIGVDHTLSSGWTISSDILYTSDINSMIVRNYGLRTPASTLNGVDNRPIYGAADRATVFGAPTNAYVFTNSDKGYSFNWSVQAKKNWENDLYTSIAYNFLESQDVSSIEAEISSDAYERNPAFGNVNSPVLAPSLYGNRHRIIGTLSKVFNYSEKHSTTISLFMEYAQGGRFSYTYSGDINNDGSGLNDLIYIPTDGEIDQMTFNTSNASEAAQRSALKSFIAQDDYLSENRGGYMEKYAILSPWYSKWDLRILQDLKVSEGNKFQLSVDILNVGNLISSKWGVRQLPQNTQPIGVSVDGAGNATYSFDTDLQSTFVDDFSLLSRWQMQVGLRYIFK